MKSRQILDQVEWVGDFYLKYRFLTQQFNEATYIDYLIGVT